MIKIGINTYSLGFIKDVEARLKKAAELGFEAIEFRPDDLGLSGKLESVKADAQKARDTLRKCGIAPCDVACDADFVQPEKGKFDHWVYWGEYCAALSKELARIAEKYGQVFAEENHGRFTNRPEVQLQLIKAVGSKRIGVCIDSSNYRWFGHPVADVHRFFKQMAPCTFHTHVKDGNGSAGPMAGYKATALGEGEIDIKLLLTELKNAGYKGDLVLEYEGSEGVEGVKRSLAFLKKTKKEVFG